MITRVDLRSARRTLGLALLLAGATGCAADAEPRAQASAATAHVVDSILPIEEHLRRFREGLPPTDSLTGGAPSRDVLVRRFAEALARHDTAGLRAMHIGRAEYAFLYFPKSLLARRPYELDPGIAWMQLTLASDKGLTRALRRFGGASFEHLRHECQRAPVAEGHARIHHGCTLHWRSLDGERRGAALFGAILELNGRFKFLGYDNAL